MRVKEYLRVRTTSIQNFALCIVCLQHHISPHKLEQFAINSLSIECPIYYQGVKKNFFKFYFLYKECLKARESYHCNKYPTILKQPLLSSWCILVLLEYIPKKLGFNHNIPIQQLSCLFPLILFHNNFHMISNL